MVSTVFTMRRPVQAHNAAVVCMAKMLDVDEEREEVFANIRAMASVGEDGLIKMWRLRFDQARGDLSIDITMQLVMQVNGHVSNAPYTSILRVVVGCVKTVTAPCWKLPVLRKSFSVNWD